MAEVTTAFTSATTGDEIRARKGSISLQGTFVATGEFQRYINGGWYTVKDGSFTSTTE